MLQYLEREIQGHHHHHKNTTTTTTTTTGQSWANLYRLRSDLTGRELGEFQARCDQFQTDKEIILAAVPLAFIMADQGRLVHTLTGRRLTSVRFSDRAEVRTNQVQLTNQEYNTTLNTLFRIELPQPLDVEAVHIKEIFQQ